MRSQKALFNKGICLNYLKRYWPLWIGYLIVVMILIPGGILPQQDMSYIHSEEELFYRTLDINRSVLYIGRSCVSMSVFSGVIAAMVMFSFMYSSRGCTMMCALPVRRESLFVTSYLTGLVPMLLIDLLVVAFTAIPTLSGGYVDGINLWRLLGMLLLSNIAFYSFGVFCAVLTGNIVVLPVVYVILNVAAVLAEQSVRSVLDIVVYGFDGIRGRLTGFSPIVASTDWFYPEAEMEEVVVRGMVNMQETGKFTIDHYYLLFIYCAVGLALAYLALRIYLKRDMECAGDVVAVPVLKPIFKYCMCFGVAFSFAALVYNNVFYRFTDGFAEAMVVLALLLVGAFMGYFVAEMLMQKTLRVFRGQWKGYIVSAAIITAFLFAAELDMTGFEKRIPAAGDVERVSISYYDSSELEKSESIDLVLDYHAQLIADKNVNEKARLSDQMVIEYKLSDGRKLSRQYPVAKDDEQLLDESSCINRLSAVVNLQEAIDKRAATEIPVTERNVQDGWLTGYYVDKDEQYHHVEFELTAAQVEDFYNNCVLPDASEGKLKRIFPVNNEEYYSCATTYNFSFGMRGDDYKHYYYDFVMYMDAPRCVEWISENTDIELLPMKEADWRNVENDTTYIRMYGKPVFETTITAAG